MNYFFIFHIINYTILKLNAYVILIIILQMDTFEGKNYTNSTSLNERTIYLKIIDTIQYLHY